MISKRCLLIHFFSVLFSTLLFSHCEIFGSSVAEAQGVKVQFTHIPPTPEALPVPGLPLTLTVQMNKDIIGVGMKVRAIIARDGQLFEVQDSEPRLDPSEKVVFRIEIPSPLQELSYQFIFVDKSGNSVGTRRYSVKRTCLPPVVGTVKDPARKGSLLREDAKQLKVTADALDSEIQLYERISSTLKTIQESIDKK